jgi:hypothetical protein
VCKKVQNIMKDEFEGDAMKSENFSWKLLRVQEIACLFVCFSTEISLKSGKLALIKLMQK